MLDRGLGTRLGPVAAFESSSLLRLDLLKTSSLAVGAGGEIGRPLAAGTGVTLCRSSASATSAVLISGVGLAEDPLSRRGAGKGLGRPLLVDCGGGVQLMNKFFFGRRCLTWTLAVRRSV